MEDPFRNRNNLIRARAKLDAFDYINLMRKKSPKSLELQADDEVIINMIEGKEVFDRAKKIYNLNSQETMKYVIELGDAVKQILLHSL
ncbi:MAG: hypothetical protein WC884_01870 [Candidatus Paceibacterota bacterium]